MDWHVRRLKGVQSTLSPPPKDAPSHWIRLVILPDDSKVDVVLPSQDAGPTEPTRIAVNGVIVGGYRILSRKLQLLISALATPHENSADHIPRYPLLEVLPPSSIDPSGSRSLALADVWALVYALHTLYHTQNNIPILISSEFANHGDITTYLLSSGLARRKHVVKGTPSDPELFLLRMTFWQAAGTGGYHHRGWLRDPGSLKGLPPFPYVPSFTRSSLVITTHPLRPPKPRQGQLMYRKYFPIVGQSLEFHYVNLEEDSAGANGGVGRHLAAFHKWHNNPRVNQGWGEAGPVEKHRQYLKDITEDPGVLPLMMSWDGELMGYTELTWIKENHVSQYVPTAAGGAQDYDRGLHILVGEEKFRGVQRSQAWMTGIIHYMFLSDIRTDRIIGEPKAENDAVIQLSIDAAMLVQTEFDFPYKHSAMTWSLRDRFFKFGHWCNGPVWEPQPQQE